MTTREFASLANHLSNMIGEVFVRLPDGTIVPLDQKMIGVFIEMKG